MRDVRWLTDREDPRTVLTACVGILVFLAVFAKPMVDKGIPALWVALALAVAVVQLVWALRRYRRSRADRKHDLF